MDAQVNALETQILKREGELEGFYQRLLEETEEIERRAIIRDIILQKEMNELLMQSLISS